MPSANYVPIWVKEGLLLEARPDQMENFKNVDERWVNVPWDEGRHYTVPWQWGVSGIGVNTKVYGGDINTSAIWLDPPAELVGKINVEPEMTDVLFATIRYFGGEWCTDDRELLKKVRDKLVEAKPKWLAMDYSVTEKLPAGDYSAVYYWNGAILRSRLANPDIKFGYPKEGYPIFMDSVAILKDAKNVENAKLFMNFIMDPENAALISAFAKYANGIKGSDAVHACRNEGRSRTRRASRIRDGGPVPDHLLAGGQRPLRAHLDRREQVDLAGRSVSSARHHRARSMPKNSRGPSPPASCPARLCPASVDPQTEAEACLLFMEERSTSIRAVRVQ